MQKEKKLDKLLIGVSLVVVFAIVACLAIAPTGSQRVANSVKSFLIDAFGSGTLIFTLAGVVLLVAIGFSKYGKIKLGDGAPEYSTFKWIAMMMSCGLGSATCYWAFIEWAYYAGTPGLSIEPMTQLALEMSVPYTMFHWGVSAWSLYALVGIPMAYHFHVRKNKGLSLSGMVSSITGLKQNSIVCRIVDIIFIFICFGGLSITLGVSVPLVTDVLCSVIGIQSSFGMNLAIIIILSVIYSLSSYIGIQKGMSKISDWNIKLVIIFTIGVLVCGPTLFILNNVTQSFGLMVQNFVHMSLFTDPIGKSGFPGAWTVFYWLYWITYAPFTGIFIARVSKGRTIRSVILNTLISGSLGCFLYFGVLGSLSLEASDHRCGRYGWNARSRQRHPCHHRSHAFPARRPGVHGRFLHQLSALPCHDARRRSLYHGLHVHDRSQGRRRAQPVPAPVLVHHARAGSSCHDLHWRGSEHHQVLRVHHLRAGHIHHDRAAVRLAQVDAAGLREKVLV